MRANFTYLHGDNYVNSHEIRGLGFSLFNAIALKVGSRLVFEGKI
ncbi:hypothetical protein ALT785_270056 [Alteromonas infernus]